MRDRVRRVEQGALALLERSAELVELRYARLHLDATAAHLIAAIVVDAIGDMEPSPRFGPGVTEPSSPADPPGAASGGVRLTIENYDGTQPPGVFLEQWATHRDLRPAQAAELLDIPVDSYRSICVGAQTITPKIARHLSIEHGGIFTPNQWLKLERQHRAKLVEQARTPDLEEA